jgi:FHS family L-fucose permease-like MFS transporter
MPDAKVQIASATIPVGYFIFLLGSFVVGSAATIMQVVLNPYLTACTVKGTQPVQRLQIGGSSNSVGTTVAPYFVTGIVFGGLSMSEVKVEQLMIPFLSLMVVIGLVALALTRFSLPDIQGTKAAVGEKLEKSVWSFSHLTLGVVAVFFYVGVEVAIGANINLYALSLPDYVGTAALMATLYWSGMLVGRLISSSFTKISPQVQLSVTAVLATVFTAAALALNNPWLLVVVGLFHSVMWGAIFTLSVNKLGKYTSVASGVFMIGVLGGAVLPLMQGALADVFGSWRMTWWIVIIGEVYLLYYALIGSKVKQSAE